MGESLGQQEKLFSSNSILPNFYEFYHSIIKIKIKTVSIPFQSNAMAYVSIENLSSYFACF